MKLYIGRYFEESPITWQNMIHDLRSNLGIEVGVGIEWDIIDNFLYVNFRGRLDGLARVITFESEAYYNWFVLRYSS